ncbi:Peptidylprolyl isomerase [Chlorociboria aeruginascens]|nr:Peptidylprolyl isomerase [Chlorociboria aeruginascens]
MMAGRQHLRIGVFIPNGAQLLDLSPVDLFGMLSSAYLTACQLPAPLVNLGIPSTIHYISVPKIGSQVEMTASAFLRITKTIHDVEVQPGMLDILLIPGPDPASIFEEDVLKFVRHHAGWKGKGGEMADILSICTGCFILGQSGVLKGKRASGPRAIIPTLRKKFPDTVWVDDKRWVIDGNIWSSGGITNGQEMVAAYLREKLPGPVTEAVVAMAEVGEKGIEYSTGKTTATLWFVCKNTHELATAVQIIALYGLEVPCGDIIIPAVPDFPATFRITMAAIDPSAPAEIDENSDGATRPRATLKIIRQSSEGSDNDEEDDDPDYLQSLLAASDSEEEDSEEEELNGGPSDPAKSKKAQRQAALQQLMDSIHGDSDEEMEDTINGTNGTKEDKKGKAKATSDEEEDSEEESDDGEDIEIEEFVLCTLDTEKNYQQPLDITIAENESVFFKVSGTHTIYLTGNYVIPDDNGHNHHHEVYDSDDSEDEDYDLSPDEDELELDIDEDESDALDQLEDPRIIEVDTDEEEAPKLVKADKKGKNKRAADKIDEGTSLDEIMAKSLKPDEEPKLSKKQSKRLKKNDGQAVTVKSDEPKTEDPQSAKSDKSDKKVQFAKNLEQGPTGSAKAEVVTPVKESGKATLGVKTVNGVKIDDKKLGTGRVCKKGDRVSMRYIGKLTDGKVFDANKKGKPFSFKLGLGDVIQGWDIGVAGMAIGGERKITVPAHLAYGKKTIPGIPANSTLIFDLKLLEIK